MINQILSIPDWQKLTTFTSSTPASGFSQIYPGPFKYWYVQDPDGGGFVKRLAYDVQFGSGLGTVYAATESFVDKRIDVVIGSGLTYSYDGQGSAILVAGLTFGNLNITNPFSDGYVLSGATSGTFQWIPAGGSNSVAGTSGSIAKFTTPTSVGTSIMSEFFTPGVTMTSTPTASYIKVGQDLTITNTQYDISMGVQNSLLVQSKLFFGDNPNRFIGLTNTNDLEIRTTDKFILTEYNGLNSPTGPQVTLIETNAVNSTVYQGPQPIGQEVGLDRSIEFLSGLVSVNDNNTKPSLFATVNTKSPTYSTEAKALSTIIVDTQVPLVTVNHFKIDYPNIGTIITGPFNFSVLGTVSQASEIVNLINSSPLGYSATNSANVVTVYAPNNYGSNLNGKIISFSSSNSANLTIVTFSGGIPYKQVALGLSGGGIQIKDGTEGLNKVLISSTTQGHGVWTDMVKPGVKFSLPLYLNNNDVALGTTLSWTFSQNFPLENKTYSWTSSFGMYLSMPNDFGTASLVNEFTYLIPFGGTYAGFVGSGAPRTPQFLMSGGLTRKWGTVELYDENENKGNLLSAGRFVKDISNNTSGVQSAPAGQSTTAILARQNSYSELLSSIKPFGQFTAPLGAPSNTRAVQSNVFPEVGIFGRLGATVGTNYQETLYGLASPGLAYWPKVLYNDTLYYSQPQNRAFSPQVNKDVWVDTNRYAYNIWGIQGARVNSNPTSHLNTQVIRRRTTAWNNVMFQPIHGPTAGHPDSFTNSTIPNVIYEHVSNRMGYTGSNLRMDTVLGSWMRLEHGYYNFNLTQSTGLFINPQFGGSIKDAALGLSMTMSRSVGIQVAHEVGMLTYQPAGYINEVYDFFSARLANGSTFSGVGDHVGFYAQSKLTGRQWDPAGRRTYDYGESQAYDLGGINARTTPRAWPTFSAYPNKPWAFYAERDKSNLGGGLLIDMGATFGTQLRAYLEIEGVTQSTVNRPFTVSSTISVFQRDGSYITYPFTGVTYATFSQTYPQVLLRPGVTPSFQEDGSLWYTPGNLAFRDGGTTYNLLTPTSTTTTGNQYIRVSATQATSITLTTSYFATASSPTISNYSTSHIYIVDFFGGNTQAVNFNIRDFGTYGVFKDDPIVGLTNLSSGDIKGASGSGLPIYYLLWRTSFFQFFLDDPTLGGINGAGIANYVPVWGGGKLLTSTSSIYINNGGNGNVGINTFNPSAALDIVTNSFSPTNALKLSGSILYQDGSQGNLGSVMMADATGKTFLTPVTKPNEVVFGSEDGTRLTSTSNFKFWPDGSLLASTGSNLQTPTQSNILLGGSCHNISTSPNSSIIGGTGSTITNLSTNSSIIGGCRNIIGTSSILSTIIGGNINQINCNAFRSSIISSELSVISGDAVFVGQVAAGSAFTNRAVILGGSLNKICRSFDTVLIGGRENVISHSGPAGNFLGQSSIVGGCKNCINAYAYQSGIVGGSQNSISNRACRNVILGGCNNKIYNFTWTNGAGGNDNAIIGGTANSIENQRSGTGYFGDYGNCSSVIIGGNLNKIGCQNVANQSTPGSVGSVILGGRQNVFIRTDNSSIIGGNNNSIRFATNSTIVGASGASMSRSCNSLILGGVGLSLSSCNNMVYVPSLMINSAVDDTTATCYLVWDPSTKTVKSRTGASGGSGGVGPQGPTGIQGDAGVPPEWYFMGAFPQPKPISFVSAIGEIYTFEGQTWYNSTSANSATPSVANGWTLLAARGTTGPTGSGSGITIGTFNNSTGYADGANITSNVLTMGAANATQPGLVTTASQTFAGNKTFNGSVLIGPTSNNSRGIFLYDNSGLTYSGFIGATGNATNTLYRLPSEVTVGRYLKVVNQNGDNYELSWATAAGGGPGGLLPAKEIGFGDGSAIVSDSNFCFDSSNCDFIASSIPTNVSSSGMNTIIGGSCHNLSSNTRSVIFGGMCGSITKSDNSVILGASASICACTGASNLRSNAILMGENNRIFATASNCNTIINGCGNYIGQECNNIASIIGGSRNNIYRWSSNSFILGGDSNIIFRSRCSAVISAVSSCVSRTSGEVIAITNSITNTFNVILNGQFNFIIGSGSSFNTVIGGFRNCVVGESTISGGVFAGNCNAIGGTSSATVLLGGTFNDVSNSIESSIIGGCNNTINNSACSLITTSRASCINPGLSTNATIKSGIILGGDNNQIVGSGSNFATIINGNNQAILGTNSNNTIILGGIGNSICRFSEASTIIGGNSNTIFHQVCSAIISSKSSRICLNTSASPSDTQCSNIIIGGDNNLITGTNSRFLTIINGNNQCICGCNTQLAGIFAGSTNRIDRDSSNSVIIGGENHVIFNSSRSVIVGGSNLGISGSSDTVLVPNLRVNNVTQPGTLDAYLLTWNPTDKKVNYRLVSSLPSSPGGPGGGTISVIGFDSGPTGSPVGAFFTYSGEGFGIFTFSAASNLNPGMVSTYSQSFKGNKTFLDNIYIGSTANTSQEGLYFYDTSTYSSTFKYTGFVPPNANSYNRILGNTGKGPTWSLQSNMVYELPGQTASMNQFLMITGMTSSGVFTTYSTEWASVGLGLTVSNNTINLLTLSPAEVVSIPGTFSTLNTFTASLLDNNKLFNVYTGQKLYTIYPPSALRSRIAGSTTSAPPGSYVGYEFFIRKADDSEGVVSIITGDSSSAVGVTPSQTVTLDRIGEIVGIKYNSLESTWISYVVDPGLLKPNTVLGNFSGTSSQADEYQVIDFNDPQQKALNYTEGGFDNDWQSGVIYSSIDPLLIPTTTSTTPISLINISSNQFIGLVPATPTGLIIPTYSLVRGKQLRVKMSGTYSKAAGTNAGFQFYLANNLVSIYTYSVPSGNSTASFDLEYNLKIRYGGQDGSVYGDGKIFFDEVASPAAPAYLLNSYNNSFVNVNLSGNAIFDIKVQNSSGNLAMTVNSTTIERLA